MLTRYIHEQKKLETCPKDTDTKYQDYIDKVLSCSGLINVS